MPSGTQRANAATPSLGRRTRTKPSPSSVWCARFWKPSAGRTTCPQQSLSPARPGEGGRQRRHPRPPAVRRRRVERPRRRSQRSGRALPRGAGRTGEQTLRPAAGRPGWRRPRTAAHVARPNPALSGNRPRRLRRPHPLGHAHQRPRLAALRRPRPPACQRLLRSRPAGPAASRPRRRPAGLPPALPSRRLRPGAGRRPHLSGRRPARGAALRGTGGARPVQRRLHARLPAPRGGPRRRQRRQPSQRPRGRPDFPLPPAVRPLRRGPRPAAGQRFALRRLRPAQERARQRGGQNGAGAMPFPKPPAITSPTSPTCSASSTAAIPPSACRHTTAACSRPAPRRCWMPCACPTP